MALLDHLIEGTPGPITEESLSRAILWGRLLYQHAERAYAAVTAGAMDAAKILSERISAGGLNDRFTVRDVYRKNWAMLSNMKDAGEALEILVDLGWLRTYFDKQPGADGRPTTRYLINPCLKLAA